MTTPETTIGRAPPQRQIDALQIVFPRLDNAARADWILQLLDGANASALSGLLEARRAGRTVGAVWARAHPGGMAEVWPPGLSEGEPEETACQLLDAICGFLRQSRVTIAQAILAPDQKTERERLLAHGFHHVADLVYLIGTESHFPEVAPPLPVRLEPYTQANHDRLTRVVLRTYEGTLDCPQVAGMRKIDDVLDGYRATGQFDPGRWLIARAEGHDVGCLLLADHPRSQQMELVYMALVPEVRGNGWGLALVRHAQWIARSADRNRLVLAVDRRNTPARRLYDAAGLVTWIERSVLLHRVAGVETDP